MVQPMKISLLPPLKRGDVLEKQEIEPKQHFTQPPPRYTEARLVKTLEELGIGRPSTYAPTLETIQKRGYVAMEEKKFMPTELGELVIEQMEEFFPEILNVEFTAIWKMILTMWRKVRRLGQSTREFYESFEKRLEFAEEEMKEIEIEDEVSDEICEKCGKHLVYKLGRFGKFLACSGFPDCRNTKPIVKDIGVTCPKCEEGHVIERRSKKGRIFFGCDQYPECDYVSWDKPSVNHVRNAAHANEKSGTKRVYDCNVRNVTIMKTVEEQDDYRRLDIFSAGSRKEGKCFLSNNNE